nr:MAG TPA: hypothetical protein [Bacteriophage sp.]
MTVNDLLNKARKAANDKVWPYYLEICDGNMEEAKEWIEHERKAGVIDNDIKHWTLDNIHQVIRTISKTTLMSDAEKKAAIDEIHECPEWQQLEREVATMFANRFVQYKDAYLK